ncbi:hypothetical protein OH76DRAFT_1458043 [Lentinus brumalis]|uniref:Uncharacterized protein n=1 Tax=Lentinus brumalis TaxID=2498619 RepID=A0A371CVN7_9APHY|nr:hypothetical protein OH76DRAFT_1458043 [Polyporus brumalis]
MAIEMFHASGSASEDNYADNCKAFMRVHPEEDVLSYERVKSLIAKVTGIAPIKHDMCTNSCLAYTGPFDQLDHCPICPTRESRYDPIQLAKGKRVSRRTFSTFPVGPQLQILRSSPDTARLMRHRREVTRRVRAQVNPITEIDDLFQGALYLDEVDEMNITDDDMVLMFSVDGAQLYASKSSDCWFLIWVVFELPPEHRYKKRFVLPAGVIGGPNKPKLMDSFLFPTFYHISAIQREGLMVWDAIEEQLMCQNIYVVFGTADTPGLIPVSGGVGHQGFLGCRTGCKQEGRSKPGGSTYYPAALKPHNYTSRRGGGQDVDYRLPPESAESRRTRYREAIARIRAVRTEGDYMEEQCLTGFGKPSIFLGMLDGKFLSLPTCLPMDPMHLLAVNIPEHYISLLRGTLVCDKNLDNTDTWPWACFLDPRVWLAHGLLMESYGRYLPGSFGHTPWNIALKITSGYKAAEWMTYTWTILPTLLRHILPHDFFIHFCHLVAGARVALQRTVKVEQLGPAHEHLILFVEQFEANFYQRRLERLHFVRPCIHVLVHLIPEIYDLGSGVTHCQWCMENFIGNVTGEVHQHVLPYAVVTQRCVRRVQVRSIVALCIEPPSSVDLGNGYVLMRARERSRHLVQLQSEHTAIHAFFQRHNTNIAPEWIPFFKKWGRLRVERTGQIARTAWKECEWEAAGKIPRRARMVRLANDIYAEVQYFFQIEFGGHERTLVMLAPFSAQDEALYRTTFGVLTACMAQPNSRLVVDAKDIASVVAMFPAILTAEEEGRPDAADLRSRRFYVGEKLGMEISILQGYMEPDNVDEEDPDTD